MPILSDYAVFTGRNWETAAAHNFMAYRGFKAPHTGQPYSEALMMGVSGGAVMGYFSFAYEGIDPMCRILTRNTFSPYSTMLSRLGVQQEIHQTTLAARAQANLKDVLASGVPAVVWADRYMLPYNAPSHDEGMWMMAPVLVPATRSKTSARTRSARPCSSRKADSMDRSTCREKTPLMPPPSSARIRFISATRWRRAGSPATRPPRSGAPTRFLPPP